jgi:hypothetical protein
VSLATRDELIVAHLGLRRALSANRPRSLGELRCKTGMAFTVYRFKEEGHAMALTVNPQVPVTGTQATQGSAPATPTSTSELFADSASFGSTSNVATAAAAQSASAPALTPEEQTVLAIAQQNQVSGPTLAFMKQEMLLQNLQAQGASPQALGAAQQALVSLAQQLPGVSPQQVAQLQLQMKTSNTPSGMGLTTAQQTMLSMLKSSKVSPSQLALTQQQMMLQNGVATKASPQELGAATQNLVQVASSTRATPQQLTQLQLEVAQMRSGPGASPEESMLLSFMPSTVPPSAKALMQLEMQLQDTQAQGGSAQQVSALRQQLISQVQAMGASPAQVAQLQQQLASPGVPGSNGLTAAQSTLLSVLGSRVPASAKTAFAAQMALQNSPTPAAAQGVLKAVQALGVPPAQVANFRLELQQLVADQG